MSNETAITKEHAIQLLRMDKTTDIQEQRVIQGIIECLEKGAILAWLDGNGELRFRTRKFAYMHKVPKESKA
jgi:hypothetical protein